MIFRGHTQSSTHPLLVVPVCGTTPTTIRCLRGRTRVRIDRGLTHVVHAGALPTRLDSIHNGNCDRLIHRSLRILNRRQAEPRQQIIVQPLNRLRTSTDRHYPSPPTMFSGFSHSRAEVFRQIQWNPTPCCYDHRQGQSLDFRVGPFYLPSEQLTYFSRFWLARGAPYPGPHYLCRCQWSHTVLRLTPWVCASYWRTTGVYHDNFDDTEWQTRFELRVVQPYRWFAGLTRRGICVPLKFRIFGSYVIIMNCQHRIYILELPLSFEIIGRFLMCLLRDLISNPALFLKIRRFDYII